MLTSSASKLILESQTEYLSEPNFCSPELSVVLNQLGLLFLVKFFGILVVTPLRGKTIALECLLWTSSPTSSNQWLKSSGSSVLGLVNVLLSFKLALIEVLKSQFLGFQDLGTYSKSVFSNTLNKLSLVLTVPVSPFKNFSLNCSGLSSLLKSYLLKKLVFGTFGCQNPSFKF